MGLFEDTITKAKEIIEETGKATNEVISNQKLKFELSSLKSAVNKNYELLGQCAYRSMAEGEPMDETAEKLRDEITEQLEKVDALEKQIAKSKGQKICECGAVNSTDSKFCKACGKEI